MASTSRAELLRVSGTAGLSRQADRPTRIGELLRLWQERRRYRSDLRRLMETGPHLIADIGLLPVHAAREARKPFWQS
jgi:uncharacterized protein YjiS (DUF1127 family)